MSRTYAAALGLVAFVAMIARGLLSEGGVYETLPGAGACLLVFAAIGFVIGRITESLLEERVISRLNVELQRTGTNGDTERRRIA